MATKQYLTGTHIKLVKFNERFVTAKYVDWLNDHSLNRFLYVGRKPIAMNDISIPDGEHGLRMAIMSNLWFDNGRDALVEGDDFSEYIGTISFSSIDWICRKAEVGYVIGEKTHWGQGIATEAIELITDYGFNRLGLHKIEAGVVDGNIGSVRALEKNNFKKYAEIPDDYYLEGKFLSTHRFYKLEGGK